MKILISIVLVVTLYSITTKAQNYCDTKFCQSGKRHIACGHNGKFASTCPSNVRMINIALHKTTILNAHNEKRNLIASGKLKGYKAAARMATMQWDDELAKLAALNVRQCNMKHDQCRNTLKFTKSGQNLGALSYTGTENKKSDKEIITNRIDAWWNEYKKANMNYIDKYPSSYNGPAIGHFTVFVAEKNTRVGCAAARYKEGNWNKFLLACNYATTNIVGYPIYQSGTIGRNCKTGRNPSYNSLCSINEVYTGL